MPSAFAGSGGSDTVGRGWGAGLQGSVTVGTGVDSPARQVSLTGKWDYTNSRSDKLEAKHSGFMLEAILYKGPGRFFRFKVRYHLDAQVRHEKGTLALGWTNVIGRLIFSRPTDGAGRMALTPPAVPTQTIDGEATFVIVEKLAPATAIPTRAEAERIGHVGDPIRLRPQGIRVPEPPDITSHLVGEHVPLNPDDQVTGTKGSDRLRAELEDALEDLGIHRKHVRTLSGGHDQ